MADEKDTESIKIQKKDYDFLIEQIQGLAGKVKNLEGGVVNLERVKEHTCRIRKLDDKLVLSFSKSWNYKDPKTDVIIPKISVTLEGSKQPLDLGLVEFMRGSSFTEAKIKSKRLIDEGIKEHGLVEVKETKDWSTVGTGVRVMSKTHTPVFALDLVLEDGRELTINEEFVN